MGQESLLETHVSPSNYDENSLSFALQEKPFLPPSSSTDEPVAASDGGLNELAQALPSGFEDRQTGNERNGWGINGRWTESGLQTDQNRSSRLEMGWKQRWLQRLDMYYVPIQIDLALGCWLVHLTYAAHKGGESAEAACAAHRPAKAQTMKMNNLHQTQSERERETN